MSHIGICMLIAQHPELLEAFLRCQSDKNNRYVGTICTKTTITQIAKDALENAKLICAEHYGLFEHHKWNHFFFLLPKSFNSITVKFNSCMYQEI